MSSDGISPFILAGHDHDTWTDTYSDRRSMTGFSSIKGRSKEILNDRSLLGNEQDRLAGMPKQQYKSVDGEW